MKAMLIMLTGSIIFILGCWWGIPKLRSNLDSYDERYQVCMNIKESLIPPNQRYYQSMPWQQAAKDCEREANS